MFGNCEKMILNFPPSSNQWPQTHHIDDDHKVSMEKQSDQKQQQVALKCPRCDSSNTKFCYYNNYSLSQPRHFCKACKRYWTRGGTIRNVPVGGGCRKNKRVKRPTTTSSSIGTTSSPSSAPSANSNPSSQQPQNHIGSTYNHINPLFYGLPSNSSDLNLQFSRSNSSRISSSGYDLQPHLNALGLGIMSSNEKASDNGYRNRFTSNSSLLSGYSNNSMIFSPTSTSTMLQQKFMNGSTVAVKEAGPGSNTTFQGLAAPPLEHMQMENSNGSDAGMVALKGVKKVEEGQKNRLDQWNGACQNQMEHVGLSDPSLYWNTATTMAAAWNDQPNKNIGPSVTSLI